MKRVFAIILALLASGAMMLVAACSRMDSVKDGKAEDYKLGMGMVTVTDDTTAGKAVQTVTIVSVITDSDGKVVDCTVDCADSSMSVEGGKAAVGGTYLTKNELAQDYGMAQYSPIGKEWYEQAEYFANHVKGMDVEDVKALDLAESGKPNDTDLLSGCTIGVTDLKEALVKAMEDTQAVSFTAEKTPELTLAAITDDSGSSDATEEADGKASIATTVAAVASKDGKAMAAIIDIANPEFSFNTQGEITSVSFSGTKRELGADYGMAQYSPIGKEWYEQSAAFCQHIAGFTADEVAALELDDAGKPTDADLTAGCTISIGDFVKVASKALGMARSTGGDGGYKLGLGMVTVTDDTAAKQTTTIVSVITDGEGKIVDCVVDCADLSMSVEGGKAAVGGTYLTKNELGADYGMAQYSPIGKEWYEQAEYFANHIKGMNAEEVKALDLSDTGKANGIDLLSGCTIAISDFKEALVKAMEDDQAVSFTADAAPTLLVAAITDDSASSDATAEKDGTVSMALTVAAVAQNEGRAMAAIIDIANPEFSFNTAGEITNISFSGTKRELKADYGMAKYSPIGKEWYEQAAAFCQYIAGFDADKVAAIELDGMGKATDADLTAGCTISIGDFVKVTEKALKAAE